MENEEAALRQPLWWERYWFVSAYVFLLLCVPFLNHVISNMTDSAYKRVLRILIIIPVLGNFQKQLSSLADIVFFIYIYILMGYLKRHNNNFFEKYALPGAAICFVIGVIGGSLTSFLPEKGKIWMELLFANTSRRSALMLLMALFCFYLFKKLCIKQICWINRLASLVFGIYLFHENGLFNMGTVLYEGLQKIIHIDKTSVGYFIILLTITFLMGAIIEFLRTLTLGRVTQKYIGNGLEKLMITFSDLKR